LVVGVVLANATFVTAINMAIAMMHQICIS
jgi:hypothetical protein